MGQYGSYAYELMEINYNKALYVVEEMISNTNFIQSLTEESVLHEFSIKDVLSKFIKKAKEIITRVIDFLVSIPGKIKALIGKSSKSIEKTDKIVEDIKEKEKEPEFIFEDKEYKDENEAEDGIYNNVFDFVAMTKSFFNKNGFMPDESVKFDNIKKRLEDFENNYGDQINPNVFHNCSTYSEFVHYITTKEFRDQFKFKQKNAAYLRDHLDEIKKQSEELKEIQDQAAAYRDTWQRLCLNVEQISEEKLANYNYGDDKEMDNVADTFRDYLHYTTLLASACIRVVSEALNLQTSARMQYNAVAEFVKSCYRPNPNYKKENKD